MTYQRTTLQMSGIGPDRLPQDAPEAEWSTGSNIAFRRGETWRAAGDRAVLTSSRTVRALAYTEVVGSGYWVYATADGIYAHDGATETEITPAAGWSGNGSHPVYSMAVLGGLVVINADDRDPVFWSGDVASPAVALPDWPAGGRCTVMRAHRNFLVAVGFVSEAGVRVRWSSAAEQGAIPAEWAPSASNLAGFVDLDTERGAALDARDLRGDLIVYQRRGMSSLTFVGGNDVFAARPLFREGIAAPHAVAVGLQDVHVWIAADGDLHMTDGVEIRALGRDRIRRSELGNVSVEVGATWSGAYLPQTQQVMLAWPRVGELAASRAVVVDLETGDLGVRSMPGVLAMAEGPPLDAVNGGDTWDEIDEAWDAIDRTWQAVAQGVGQQGVLGGGAFGLVVIGDADAEDFADGPVQARLEKSGLAFGEPSRRKQVSRIWPKIEGRPGDVLEVRVGAQEYTEGPVVLDTVVRHEIGSALPVDVSVSGRFVHLSFATNGGAPWRLGSVDVEWRFVGRW